MEELFRLLGHFQGQCLLVGGHALASYGVVRQTLDVDLLVTESECPAIAARLAVLRYAERARTRTAVRFATGSSHLPDIDVLLVDPGTFEKLRRGSRVIQRSNTELRVPSLIHLIAMKLHAIRNEPRREPRDFGDIAELLRLNPHAITRDELEQVTTQFAPSALRDKVVALL